MKELLKLLNSVFNSQVRTLYLDPTSKWSLTKRLDPLKDVVHEGVHFKGPEGGDESVPPPQNGMM